MKRKKSVLVICTIILLMVLFVGCGAPEQIGGKQTASKEIPLSVTPGTKTFDVSWNKIAIGDVKIKQVFADHVIDHNNNLYSLVFDTTSQTYVLDLISADVVATQKNMGLGGWLHFINKKNDLFLIDSTAETLEPFGDIKEDIVRFENNNLFINDDAQLLHGTQELDKDNTPTGDVDWFTIMEKVQDVAPFTPYFILDTEGTLSLLELSADFDFTAKDHDPASVTNTVLASGVAKIESLEGRLANNTPYVYYIEENGDLSIVEYFGVGNQTTKTLASGISDIKITDTGSFAEGQAVTMQVDALIETTTGQVYGFNNNMVVAEFTGVNTPLNSLAFSYVTPSASTRLHLIKTNPEGELYWAGVTESYTMHSHDVAQQAISAELFSSAGGRWITDNDPKKIIEFKDADNAKTINIGTFFSLEDIIQDEYNIGRIYKNGELYVIDLLPVATDRVYETIFTTMTVDFGPPKDGILSISFNNDPTMQEYKYLYV